MWETKFTSHKQYLFVPLFSRNVKWIHTDQSIYKFSYSARKAMTHKPSNAATAKNLFFSTYVIGSITSMNVFYLIR